MRSATRLVAVLAALVWTSGVGAQTLREDVLRKAALEAGLVPAGDTHVPVASELVAAGKLIFQTKQLSLEREIACASCHLDRFGSADGLPNAIGTLGRGEGTARLFGGGDIVPRNALPFWGRGSKRFDVFFWDGRVSKTSEGIHSQFAGSEPSSDPLTVAVHLPPVEIGEMIIDSDGNRRLQSETVESATEVYDILEARLRADASIGPALAKAFGKDQNEVRFIDVATALAGFIRHNFRVQQTRFHDFVFAGGSLDREEIAGGLLFYGKGRCAACHNGPYFSDLAFHAIPFERFSEVPTL